MLDGMSGRNRRKRKARQARERRSRARLSERDGRDQGRKTRRLARHQADYETFEALRLSFAESEEPPLCQYCGTAMTAEDLVFCCSCQTPHHRDCWREAGSCTTFACGSTRALDERVLLQSVTDLSADLAIPSHDLLVIDDTGKARAPNGSHGGTRAIRLRQVPRPPRTQADAWEVIEEGGRELVKIEMLTSAELTHRVLAIGGLIFALLAALQKAGALAGIALIFSGIGIALWSLFDAYHVVDLAHGTVWYRRLLGGIDTGSVVGRIEDLHAVTVRGTRHKAKHQTWWTYEPVFVFRDGRVVKMREHTTDFRKANGLAESYASLLRRPWIRGGEGRSLVVSRQGRSCSVRQLPHVWFRDEFLPGIATTLRWGGSLALLVFLTALLRSLFL